jgi:hypothetical protein
VAYGARLESVLGESPRGFESPILRHLKISSDLLFCTLAWTQFPFYVLRSVLSQIEMLSRAVYAPAGPGRRRLAATS